MIKNDMRNSSTLIPLTVFISIVGVIFIPLSKLGGVYSWPCTSIAIAVTLFYIGCLIAEKLSVKLNKTLLIIIGVSAFACLLQKYIADAIYCKRPLYDCYIAFWAFRRLSIYTLHWIVYYAAFILVGIITNLSVRKSRENEDRFWKDFISGCSCFVLYMVLSIMPKVPEIYNHLTISSITLLRASALIPMLGTLVYVYRCATSERVLGWVKTYSILTKILVAMCPGAIFMTVINYSRNFNALSILILPIIAYILSVTYRFAIRLIRSLYKAVVSKV